jgi:hypothetical protein
MRIIGNLEPYILSALYHYVIRLSFKLNKKYCPKFGLILFICFHIYRFPFLTL